MTPDAQLLRRYAADGDEAAFAEVVHRHLPLVYSAALRLVNGHAPLAEDVAQNVFTQLARRAGALSGHPTLVGWLHTTTRYLASKAVRGEHRRQLREQEAAAMHETTTGPDINWAQLRPSLDEAVGQLRELDRNAILLHFFQGKNHTEVGLILGLTEDAARKRIERALDKIRRHFSRRGITATAALLGSTLASHAATPPPAGLAAKVATSSFAQAAGAIGFVQAIWAAYFMSTTSKVITGAIVVALIASIAVSFHHVAITRQSNEPAQNANVAALPTAQRSPVLVLSPPSKVQVAAPKLPPAPAANVPDAYGLTLVKKDITDNLRELATAGSQYMLDNGKTQARYSDLVGTNDDDYIRSIDPVGTENYQDFIEYLTQTQVTQVAPDGSIVTYNL